MGLVGDELAVEGLFLGSLGELLDICPHHVLFGSPESFYAKGESPGPIRLAKTLSRNRT